MADEKKPENLLGKVEKILRAQTGLEVERDGEQFIVVVSRVRLGRWSIKATLLNSSAARVPMGEVVAEVSSRDVRPTFDELERALYAAAAEAMRKRIAVLCAAGEE